MSRPEKDSALDGLNPTELQRVQEEGWEAVRAQHQAPRPSQLSRQLETLIRLEERFSALKQTMRVGFDQLHERVSDLERLSRESHETGRREARPTASSRPSTGKFSALTSKTGMAAAAGFVFIGVCLAVAAAAAVIGPDNLRLLLELFGAKPAP